MPLRGNEVSKSVRDHIPLEQGLRHRSRTPRPSLMTCQRPYSIRTRIKTPPLKIDTIKVRCQRPYSIRTRIKTPLRGGLSGGFFGVRDHIPLEQGLRRSSASSVSSVLSSQRPYSIRTRIKTS